MVASGHAPVNDPIHVRDLTNSDEFPRGRDRALRFGNRASLGVPLIRDGAAIGAIMLRRLEPVEFTPKQIQTKEERVKLVYRIKVDVDNTSHELKNNMPVDAEIQL